MRNLSILVVAATLGFPAMAFAGDYGTTGATEVGGGVSIQSVSYTYKPKGSSTDNTTSTTAITLAPEVGYFVMDQIELVGRLALTNTNTEGFNTTGFGLGVGAAYLLPMNGIHVGPKATLGFSSTTYSEDEFSATLSGPVINIEGVAKVPFGTGGVLGAGLGLTYAPQTISGDVEGSQTVTGFGLATSFSVFW